MLEPPTFAEYWAARYEHAWLLRAEGLKYHEIAQHLGIHKQQAASMVKRFGRHVQAAINRQRTKRSVASTTHQWAIACERAKLLAEANRWIEAWTAEP